MKIIVCAFLLLASACSFLPGADDKLADACARRQAIKGDADKIFAALDGACVAIEE